MKPIHIMPRPVETAVSARPLSPRELGCVQLAHLSNADIALALGISTHTVRANLRSAFIKLAANNRTDAYGLCLKRAA